MSARLGLLLILGLGLSACASRAPAPRVDLASTRCTASLNLDQPLRLPLDGEEPVEQNFDERSACVLDAEGRRAVYAVFRLPPFEKPYIIDIDSLPLGEALFAPEVQLIDADGGQRRSLGWDRFSSRGKELSGTVFMNPENADERYLVVRSAPQAVGQKGSRIDPGSFFVPLLNAIFPVAYVHGTETEHRYVLAHSGRVQIEAHTVGKPRRRSAQEGVREELGSGR